MSTDAVSEPTIHAGRLVARRLKASGVDTVFTLSGGHLFPIYDGCRDEGIRLIDTRHEQTAAFAAEGWSKVTRSPGVAALTAGPGITNGMSAMAAAQLMGAARREGDGLDAALAQGELRPLVGWLRDKVHRQGSLLGFNDLLRAATGKALDPTDFEAHLTARYLT